MIILVIISLIIIYESNMNYFLKYDRGYSIKIKFLFWYFFVIKFHIIFLD
jgi:hypothetical protein